MWYTNHYKERLCERLGKIDCSTINFLKLMVNITGNHNNEIAYEYNVYYKSEEGYHIVNSTPKILFYITFIEELTDTGIYKRDLTTLINKYTQR